MKPETIVVVLGLGLLLLINGLTTTRVPHAVSTVLPVASSMPSLVQATPPPIGTAEVDTLADIAYASAIDRVQEIAIREVRFISLVGVGLFIGLKLSAEAGAFVAAASTEANYKVTLTWKREQKTG